MASKVCNKEGDIILPLSVNLEVDLQNTCDRLPHQSIIPMNRNRLRQFSKNAFKKSASFTAHLVSIKVKAFVPESAKAEVKT